MGERGALRDAIAVGGGEGRAVRREDEQGAVALQDEQRAFSQDEGRVFALPGSLVHSTVPVAGSRAKYCPLFRWERPITLPFTRTGELMYMETSCRVPGDAAASIPNPLRVTRIPWVPVSWLETTIRSPARSGVTMFWSQGVTNGTLQRARPEVGSTPEDLAVDLDDDLLLAVEGASRSGRSSSGPSPSRTHLSAPVAGSKAMSAPPSWPAGMDDQEAAHHERRHRGPERRRRRP